jgi:hypothetical protein
MTPVRLAVVISASRGMGLEVWRPLARLVARVGRIDRRTFELCSPARFRVVRLSPSTREQVPSLHHNPGQMTSDTNWLRVHLRSGVFDLCSAKLHEH